MPYATTKGADQPAYPCSLISVFVVCCLVSIIPTLAKYKRWRDSTLSLWLNRPVCVLPGRKPPKTFSHGMAQYRNNCSLREGSMTIYLPLTTMTGNIALRLHPWVILPILDTITCLGEQMVLSYNATAV